MSKDVVSELNAFLKGEMMAVEVYQGYIEAAQDEKVKKEFSRIQEDHKRHIEVLSDRIKAVGGQPEQGTGIAGVMAKARQTLENAVGRDSFKLLKEAYDGEDKGIAVAEEIVKGDLDNDSRNVIKDILKQDHEHLSRMAHLIAEYELGSDKN